MFLQINRRKKSQLNNLLIEKQKLQHSKRNVVEIETYVIAITVGALLKTQVRNGISFQLLIYVYVVLQLKLLSFVCPFLALSNGQCFHAVPSAVIGEQSSRQVNVFFSIQFRLLPTAAVVCTNCFKSLPSRTLRSIKCVNGQMGKSC